MSEVPLSHLQGGHGEQRLQKEKFCMALPPNRIANLEAYIGKEGFLILQSACTGRLCPSPGHVLQLRACGSTVFMIKISLRTNYTRATDDSGTGSGDGAHEVFHLTFFIVGILQK